jgi:DNA gyrase subunit A
MSRKRELERNLTLFDARVVTVPLENEIKNSYIDYAMSVIIGRALPDARDGLKPVHRRILYAMFERHWNSSNPYVKCAKIVGEVIGNYHPHGDAAVYETLVRMAQPFTMMKPLIDGQGNFGSIDGDSPAAYRYTEARLSKIAEELLKDINKDTVDFAPNFDNTSSEPIVLPAGFPNLLVNGANGIAVGMATNIPPHNLSETIDAIIYYIDNPNCKIPDLMKFLPAPDFPTGGIIYGYQGIKEAYLTGKGKLTLRGKAEIEKVKDREIIAIYEIPYQVNKAELISHIASLVREKKIEGISNIRDESDRQGLRIVIELKRDANSQIILNQLFKHTQLQINFGIIMLALIDNQPKILNLKQLIEEYVKHRKEVVIRRTKFDLKNAEEKAHILQGLVKALDIIDQIIKTIRASKTPEIAKENLIKNFKFSPVQAQAILDMKLQKLTALEKQKLIEEYEQLLKLIKELKSILASEKKVYEVIKNELLAIKEKYGEKRKTEIVHETADFSVEDVILDEDMIITISKDGFIKSLQAKTFKRQKRGGKGVTLSTNNEDLIKNVIATSTHNNLLFFTNKGKVFWMKVYEIPMASKQSKGRSIKILLNLASDEYLTAITSLKNFDENTHIIMITKKGIIKRISSKFFENAKKKGIIGITLEKDDELIGAKIFDSETDKELIIATSLGKALKIKAEKLRPMGRASKGIKGISLANNDKVIGIVVPKPNEDLIAVTENGFGKRLKYSEIPVKGRGSKGVLYIKTTSKNGSAACIESASDNDEIIITSQNGMVLRTLANEIPKLGRNASGVKILTLNQNDKISNIAVIKQ